MTVALHEARGELHGSPRVVALGNGVGNVGVTDRLPGAVDSRIVAVTFKLVAAAGGAARRPVVSLLDGTGQPVAAVASPFTTAATVTSAYCFGAGIQQFGANDAANIGGPFVDGWLPENLTLAVTVTNGAAGDAISNVRVLLDQRPVTVR